MGNFLRLGFGGALELWTLYKIAEESLGFIRPIVRVICKYGFSFEIKLDLEKLFSQDLLIDDLD